LILPSPIDVTISHGAIAQPSTSFLTLSNLFIGADGVLTGLKAQTNLELAVLGDALIAPGGSISLDNKGYSQATGPGAGLTSSSIGSGAGYGGNGGSSSTSQGGTAYGVAEQPTERGSGGGLGYGAPSLGAEGGGALRMTVARTLTVNGRISANGNSAYQDDGGGGSGGSLWITANSLNLAGQVTVLGGSGELYEGGGGGGGRIAFYSRTNYLASPTISVSGGDGYDPGQDGTIFFGTNIAVPAVIAQNPTGTLTNGLSFVDLAFNTVLNFSSISPADILISTPNGSLAPSNLTISSLSPSSFRVSFPFQTAPGAYTVAVGPAIEDLFAQPMAQLYNGAFSLSVPVIQGTVTNASGQPVAGVVMQPDVGSAGITDANGNYVVGVSPGFSVNISPVLSG
jgi:hypothetical protein